MSIETVWVTEEDATRIIQTEESHFSDVKAIEIAPAKLTQTVSAFANAAGGELWIGIDERQGAAGREREWRGFSNTEAANALIQALESLSPLGNHYTFEFVASKNHTGLLGHITVFKTREILAASNKKIFVRRGAQKLPVETPEAIARLEYDKGITTFEDELLDIGIDELVSSDVMEEFMRAVVPSAEPKSWLKKQRVWLNGRGTVACVLLYSDQPQAILPKRSAIKILRHKTKLEGERATLAFNPITVEGPATELIYSAVDQCKRIIESIQKLGPAGMEAVTYPEEALHEIITNAVLHRDYSIAVDVQVRIFDDRVEIESPGKLPGHVSVKNILSEQSARNPKLVRLINKFPNPPNKDVGEGLNTAFEAMEKLRLKPPIIEELENSVLVVLRHESLGSPEQLVLDYLGTHTEITNSIARELTGIKSENTMKEVFYRLRDRALLEQVPGKSGSKSAWRKPLIGGKLDNAS